MVAGEDRIVVVAFDLLANLIFGNAGLLRISRLHINARIELY